MPISLQSKQKSLDQDYTLWEIGPYHGALPGPMMMRLSLDGELIAKCEIETGFLHRGLEKAFERHSWASSVPYCDRLDPEGAVFGELVYCLAIEDIGGISVPLRAQYIRMMLTELTRISVHLAFIVRMAKAVGSDTIIHYVLRDRERVIDLFELLTGARFSFNFLKLGGVRADITEGFIERVLEVCEMIRIRLKEYNDVFTFNQIFLKRSQGLGSISPDVICHYGLSGPTARASGLMMDLRKTNPYLEYSRFDFRVPHHPRSIQGGDVHDRFLIRLREISESMELLKQLADSVPLGEYTNPAIEAHYSAPPGEAYTRIESARGILGCHVVSEGKTSPSRVQFRTPTQASLDALPALVTGIRIEDLPVLLASLDLGISEADR